MQRGIGALRSRTAAHFVAMWRKQARRLRNPTSRSRMRNYLRAGKKPMTRKGKRPGLLRGAARWTSGGARLRFAVATHRRRELFTAATYRRPMNLT